MLEKNVSLATSNGGACGICDVPIKSREPVVRVKFEVPVIFTSVGVDREMHLECAEQLSQLLRKCLSEAGWK